MCVISSAPRTASCRSTARSPKVGIRQDGRRRIPLDDYLGADLSKQLHTLGLGGLHWMERRHYAIDCNWKVFVDNYLDGGYHVPLMHPGLDSVLNYSEYIIEEIGERFCLQSSPMSKEGADPPTGAARQGDRASYLDLSELHDQLLRSRHGYQPGDSSEHRQNRCDFRLLLRRCVGGCQRQMGEHQHEPPDSAGGSFDTAPPCSVVSARGPTRPADCQFVAKLESISFIGC